MDKISKQLLLAITSLALMICVSYCYASPSSIPHNLSFHDVASKSHIELGAIPTVFEDHFGFIWVGTSAGLFRYDGYTFLPVSTEGSEPKNIPYTNNCIQFESQSLYCATSQGLYKINTSNFKARALNASDHPNRNFIDLEYIDGILYIATEYGLGAYSVETGNFNHISTTVLTGSDHVLALKKDGDLLLIGTGSGVIFYDDKKKEFGKAYLQGDVIRCITSTITNYYFCTENGLVETSKSMQNIVRHKKIHGDIQSISSDHIHKVVVDKAGNIWVGTGNAGINLYNKNANEFTRFTKENSNTRGLTTNKIFTIYVDSMGDLWAGGFPSGLFYYDYSSRLITHISHDVTDGESLPHDSVLALDLDQDKNIIVGTDGGGLCYMNKSLKCEKILTSQLDNESTLSSNAILSLKNDSRGVTWIGTWGGGICSIANGKITRLPFQNLRAGVDQHTEYYTSRMLNSPHAWHVSEDALGHIWVATHTGGLSKYDRNTQQFEHFLPDYNRTNIVSTYLTKTFEDSKGGIWVGSPGGLSVLMSGTSEFKAIEKLRNLAVNDFIEADDKVWIATDRGLMSYDTINEIFSEDFIADGFTSSNILSIAKDSNGEFWLGTDNGVSIFEHRSNHVKNVTTVGGRKIGKLNRGAILNLDGKRIALGGINGLFVFSEDIKNHREPAKNLALTDIEVDTIDSGYALSGASINNIEKLILSHKEYAFEIEYSLLNYRDSGNIRYMYYLEGFDKGWKDGSFNRGTKYTNIDPGTYIFRVKGVNRHGEWSEVKSLKVIQMPAPWRTWWAYAIYIVLMTGVLVFIYKIKRQRTLLRMELDNERKLSSEYQRIDELKNTYFANITHDLRGPLSALLSMNEHLREELREVTNPQDRKLFGVQGRTLTRLLYLVNEILDSEKVRQGGEVIYDLKPVDLSEVIDRVVSLSQDRANDKGLEICNHVDADNLIAQTDEFKIEGVIENLLSNAIKYTDEGTISILAGRSDDNTIYVHVKDTGIGIAEENLDRVFESMFQDSSAGGRGASGTGLGLTNA